MSSFLRPIDYYQRRFNPIRDYISQMGFYSSKLLGHSRSECEASILNNIKNKAFPNLKDPNVVYFERGENEDRFRTNTKLSKYITEVNQSREVLAPTFTTYLHPEVKESLIVNFMTDNKAKRSKAKKLSQAAKAKGDLETYILEDGNQTNMKLANNSVSGAFVAMGTVLNNPSAHSTLTSTTRSVASLSNASNEKVIAGNRHYFNPEVTLNNIISIASNVNTEVFVSMLNKYGMCYPTVEDMLECIRYSTDLYWVDTEAFKRIEEFVHRLSDVERAACVYIGDLYHIRKHNDKVVRALLGSLATIVEDRDELYRDSTYMTDEIHTYMLESLKTLDSDPIKYVYGADEAIVNYVQQLCRRFMTGKGKDYAGISRASVMTLGYCIINVNVVLMRYREFIDEVFLSYNVPSNTAQIGNMIRRTVAVSDTDSTLFSTDEFVEWYYGEMRFDDGGNGIACGVAYIATQVIAHNLAILSANMGVARDKLFLLSMKSEFTFSALTPTSVAKHYYAYVTVKEGDVYKEPELEVKGVHLKDSSKPKALLKLAEQKMGEILTTATSGGKISLYKELRYVADIERKIIDGLMSGDTSYFKQAQVKIPEAYSRSPEESPYGYHLFWNRVLGPKYGFIDEPPYGVIKMPTIVENITGVKSWLASIEDVEFRDRLAEWLKERSKTSLPTVYINTTYVKSYGIPKELLMVMDTNRIVLDLTTSFRLILETLSYYSKPGLLISHQGY